VPKADKCFLYVAQALEAETLVGTTAVRIVNSTKALIQTSGLNANELLAALSPEAQQTVRSFFG
jgi:hypothetical protein